MRKYIIGRMRVKPGTRDELLAAAKPFIARTREEPGCVFFEMAVSASDPDGLVIAEAFENAAAHEAHEKSAHMAALRLRQDKLLVEAEFEFIYSDKIEHNGGSVSRPIT